MQYHLTTLGCPKNTVDSRRLVRALAQAGHRATDAPGSADVLLVNSCGFIDEAKAESARVAGGLGQSKTSSQRLAVIGCWSQIEAAAIRRTIPAVDATFGIEAWDQIVEWFGPAQPSDLPETAPASASASAYLKISDGCAHPCTFCNIPGIKGRRFRSTPMPQLVEEAQRQAQAGVRELILVAQDSTSYGVEEGQPDGPAALLERLAAAVPQVPWLRLMYAYPGVVSDRLIETMAAIPQVCHYLDLPLQHGSEAVLRRMRRPHDPRLVHRTLERLRRAMPDIAIRTTFIVGFPGETKAEFEQLLDFVRQARFDHLGAFVYSPQAGTPAALMPGQISDRVKQRRLRRLMSVQSEIAAEINQAQVGRELPLLVESIDGQRSDDGAPLFVGRTYRDAPEIDGLVFCPGVARAGSMPIVRITGAAGHDLVAEPVSGAAIPLIVR